MRSPVTNRSAKAVYAEVVLPGVVESLIPVASSTAFLSAGEDGQSFVDVHVDSGELPCGVPPPKVRAPTPQHWVEIRDYGFDRSAHVTTTRPVPYCGTDRRHRPI
jgi:hypothetical protein